MQRANPRVPPPPGHREVEHFISLVLDVAETLLLVRDWDGRPPFRRDLEWRMLSLLARHRGYLGISDLAQRCGVNRMCSHRTVRRLADRRLVEFAVRLRALHGHDRWAAWPGGWP
jgi:hypothetical protein